MSKNGSDKLTRRLWRGSVGLMALILASGSGLVVALSLGWNSPRPIRPPDWQAPMLPLTMTAGPEQTEVTLLGLPDGDHTVEVEAEPIAGPALNEYGLVYRAQDTSHYYVLAIGGDGYYAVLRASDGEETPLVDWQQFPHVQRGREKNRLRAACSGATCDLFINDELAATVEDETWLVGDVGLWVRDLAGQGVTVRFSSAQVWTDR